MRLDRVRWKGMVVGLAIMGFAPRPAHAVPYFFTDFDGGAPAQFSDVTTTESVQGYTGLGPAGNQFGGKFLRNASAGNPASASILILTGLPSHTSIVLGFLLGIIDSWDGDGSQGWGPDVFNVKVDGTLIFSRAFSNVLCCQTYTPPAGVELAQQTSLGWNDWPDDAYNMALEPTFISIPHTASTLQIQWYASGRGWQGGSDESWAIDNVSVTLNGTAAPVPEPATTLLLGSGLLGLGGIR